METMETVLLLLLLGYIQSTSPSAIQQQIIINHLWGLLASLAQAIKENRFLGGKCENER